MTREEWLTRAVELMRDGMFKRCGETVPAVRVSVGFPGGGSARKRIGECWNPQASADGLSQVFINPVLSDGVRVLDVLAHELIHAIVPAAGHKAPFKRIATAIGLTGPMRATEAGPELKAELDTLILNLGEYPHAALSLSDRKKQTTRMVKMECPSCGFICRASQTAIEGSGLPTCGCGERLNIAGGES